MPRPVAYRASMLPAVVNALLAGSTYRAACEAAGIPWRTWCDWAKAHRAGGHSDPDVDGLIAAAREAYAKATNAITAQVRVAAAKDWRAAAFLLDHRRGDPAARAEARKARAAAAIAEREARGTDGHGDALLIPKFLTEPREGE